MHDWPHPLIDVDVGMVFCLRLSPQLDVTRKAADMTAFTFYVEVDTGTYNLALTVCRTGKDNVAGCYLHFHDITWYGRDMSAKTVNYNSNDDGVVVGPGCRTLNPAEYAECIQEYFQVYGPLGNSPMILLRYPKMANRAFKAGVDCDVRDSKCANDAAAVYEFKKLKKDAQEADDNDAFDNVVYNRMYSSLAADGSATKDLDTNCARLTRNFFGENERKNDETHWLKKQAFIQFLYDKKCDKRVYKANKDEIEETMQVRENLLARARGLLSAPHTDARLLVLS